MSFSKPRTDAVLRNLSEVVHTDLVRGLVVENWSYKQAKSWLETTHQVKTSLGALSEFWRTDCVRIKFLSARRAADDAKEYMKDSGEEFAAKAIDNLSQKVFELSLAPGVDADEVATLVRAITAHRRVENQSTALTLANRRVTLLESNAVQAKAKLAEALGDGKGGMSAEALKRIEEAANLL